MDGEACKGGDGAEAAGYGPFSREDVRRIDESEVVRLLFESGAVPAGPRPLMIDVGACGGSAFRRFAEAGWAVHAFEPNPPVYASLRDTLGMGPQRPDVTLSPLAVSDRDGQTATFYTSDESIGISSLRPFRRSHKPTARVRTIRLDSYCEAAGIDEIDFLKIDTEGFDLMVLQGLGDWERRRPRVILTEFENVKSRPLGYDTEGLVAFLRDRGYAIHISEWWPVTRYGGTEHRWKRLVQAPADDLDPAGWGNLIAFRDALADTAVRDAVVREVERASQAFARSLAARPPEPPPPPPSLGGRLKRLLAGGG